MDVQHEVLPNGKGHRVRVHWGSLVHTAFGDTYTEALDRALDALEARQGIQADLRGLERLRLRTYSTFAYFTPDELEAGFRRLEQAVAADPDTPVPDVPATMLTLERC